MADATIKEYVLRSYRHDLDRFAANYRGALSRAFPGQLGLGPSDKLLWINDGDPAQIASAMRGGLDDPLRFAVVLALDATLFAGVHAYDSGNFAGYVEALPVQIFVETYCLGVRRPHVVLAGVKEWTSEALEVLETSWADLLLEWARTYDEKFRRRRAASVVQQLRDDPDLKRNPWPGHLPDSVVTALQNGLRRAAMQLA